MNRLACLASVLPLVAAHGFISSPPARRPGDAYRATCGEQPFYQQSSDINGNVQGIQQVVGNDKTDACNLWLCKGFLLEDNPDKVQSFSLGQTIDFKINIAAPHTGYANVSVVKTSTNTMIGTPLIEFSNYASNAGVSANNSAFSVTLPSNLGSDCTTAGDCVLQWFWDAPDIDQTYEACVDFTVSGSGSGSAPSSAPATSEAAATSTPVPTARTTTTSVIDNIPTTTTTTTTAATTTAPAPEETGDEECPAEDGEGDGDEEDGNAGEDEECPAEDGEGDDEEGDDDAGEDDECPAEDGEGEGEGEVETSAPASAPAPSATASASLSRADNDAGSFTSTITQVVTSTVTSERLVTVTAPATACN